MKKVFLFIAITQVLSERMGVAQELQTIYSETRCGLDFTQVSVLLGKRMAPYGYPYYGIDQPAPLTVSGIPANAKIEKAFVWWDIAGSDTTENIILKNPEQETDTFSSARIGGTAQCWGIGTAFRADVTSIISGNGTYLISGLPTDSTFDFANKSDVTGATLFIIYSDPANSFLGNLIINDGYLKVFNDTILETLNFSPPSDTTTGKAFMILSDMQGQSGNAIKMNNGPFTIPVQDYWDYEEKNTVYVPSINYSIFGMHAPNDCVQLIALGIYFQSPIIPLSPQITRFGDVLTASQGAAYQWYLNNSPIGNATFQNYLAAQSGNYFMAVTDSFGCSFFSDTINFVLCNEKIKPNINFELPDSLWTDSTNYSLQWFNLLDLIEGATFPYHIATENGDYYVQAKDTIGCSVNSDFVNVTGLRIAGNERQETGIVVYPNPNDGNFELRIADLRLRIENSTVNIYTVLGNKVYSEKIRNQQCEIRNLMLPSGIYFLKIILEEGNFVKKLVVE